MARRTGGVDEFAFDPVADSRPDFGETTGMCVVIGVSGWLSDKQERFSTAWSWLGQHVEGCEAHALRWESPLLVAVGGAIEVRPLSSAMRHAAAAAAAAAAAHGTDTSALARAISSRRWFRKVHSGLDNRR